MAWFDTDLFRAARQVWARQSSPAPPELRLTQAGDQPPCRPARPTAGYGVLPNPRIRDSPAARPAHMSSETAVSSTQDTRCLAMDR